MAHRPKRKLDSFLHPTSSLAAMPQTNIAGSSIDLNQNCNDRYTPTKPTTETQELYNAWRQQEELDAHLKEQAEPVSESNDGAQHTANGLLSPALAVAMSRSPSYASTSNSVTGGINNIGLGDDEPARKRQGRQGPLSAADKARTALLRKLRACESCRSRKVKCNHYNFRRFEDAYQLSKRIVQPVPQITRQDVVDNRVQQHNLLFGVGVGVGGGHNLSSLAPGPFIFGGASTGQGDANGDWDNLVSHTDPPLSPNSTAPLYNFGRNMPVTNSINTNSMPLLARSSPYPQSFSPGISPTSAPLRDARTTVTESRTDRHFPIGRRIVPGKDHGLSMGHSLDGEYGLPHDIEEGGGEPEWEWECRWGDDGTASSYSNTSDGNETPYICKRRYDTLENLETHYQEEHVPFENGKIYPFCTLHQQHYDYEIMYYCPRCGGDGGNGLFGTGGNFSQYQAAGNSNSSDRFQEQWYFGDILPVQEHDNGQRRTGRVLSDDGGLAGGVTDSLARSGTLTQFDVWNSSTSFIGGGYGGGTANQGTKGRGNSAFPGGEYSCPMPPDVSSGSSGGKDGNNGHRYGDIRVNLVLSPPTPSSKIVPLAPSPSKMLFSSSAGRASYSTITHDDEKLCSPSVASVNTNPSVKPTRERSRSCPYYAYTKELIGARRSRSLKRGSASGVRSRSSISLSSNLRWPSAGYSSTSILVDSSSSPSASKVSSTFLRLLFLTLGMILLTHGLSFSSSLPPSSTSATTSSTGRTPVTAQVPWNNKNLFLPLLFPFSSPSETSKTAAARMAELSVMCIILGFVGMWLAKRTVSFRRVLLAADNDGIRLRR